MSSMSCAVREWLEGSVELREGMGVLIAVVLRATFNTMALVGIKWIDWLLVGVAHMVSMAGGSREDLSCGAADSIVEFGWLAVVIPSIPITIPCACSHHGCSPVCY